MKHKPTPNNKGHRRTVSDRLHIDVKRIAKKLGLKFKH